ncbi:hypothetical protein [Nitrospira moscoviensis]|uniref:Lipoprotein n=1 Tax=Nitrospira moscoviensis TaxID=42253 RepID=A0A0K2GC55_NITMO|nr:hypothetical protein [Nitrospira moscoviensis]ALA58535.1 conserved exported protein of unknown function [Nitrospira moscoviensis]
MPHDVMLRIRFAVVPLLLSLLAGCASAPAPRTVHQDSRTVVQLRIDQRAKSGHSHPAGLTRDQMVAILSGVRVRSDREAIHRLFSGEAEERPAFTSEEVWALAAPIAKALAQAKPDELVTFYRRVSDQTVGLAFTTGGIFVRGDEVYVILANSRQIPADAMALGIPAYEMDPVDDPLLPLRRAGYTVGFVPKEAEVHGVPGTWTWEYSDPGKVVVINTALLPRPSRSR